MFPHQIIWYITRINSFEKRTRLITLPFVFILRLLIFATLTDLIAYEQHATTTRMKTAC